jgi:hypothetical protein
MVNNNAHGGAIRAKGAPYGVENLNLLFIDFDVLFPDETHFNDAAIPEVGVKDTVENS